MPVQRKVLFQWIGFYENHGGEWLKDFPWRECSFHWSGAMTDSDVLGAASSVFHDVYLQNEATELWAGSGTWTPEIWGALIAPTAIHELRHLYQRKKMGLLIYAMLALPVIRCVTLEKDAAAVAEQAEKIITEECDRLAMEMCNQKWKRETDAEQSGMPSDSNFIIKKKEEYESS